MFLTGIGIRIWIHFFKAYQKIRIHASEIDPFNVNNLDGNELTPINISLSLAAYLSLSP